MSDYREFLAEKAQRGADCGIAVAPGRLHPALFPFQRDLTAWALRKGRAAVFADTGLGKTGIQCEWARQLDVPTLILAPLSVARQTVGIARDLLGLEVRYVRSQAECGAGISITNYEMLEHFDPAAFGAVVLDESSILKAMDGATRATLTAAFADTPYRLCCTATPAPNDIAEIGNHAEFLGVCRRTEMLASYFVHDSDGAAREGWRLKGHAVEPFYRWLASWAMSVRRPSDLGYSDDGYDLPPLAVTPHVLTTGYAPEGYLLPVGLGGIQGRSAARRSSLAERVAAVASLVGADDSQWIVWCGLNEEGRALKRVVGDAAVLIEGSQSADVKAQAIEAFQDGRHRVMVTKASITGFGLNLQCAHKMAFCGLSDSWEAYYQAVRRCYRFGQRHPVQVHIVLSDAEEPILANVQRKEKEAAEMADRLIAGVQRFEREALAGQEARAIYETGESGGSGWRLLLGDSAERMAEIEDASIDLSVFSPPFMSLYTYSPSDRDLGNSRSPAQFFQHFGFVIDHLLRITKPGRNACVHVAQVPAILARDGYTGLKDFRGPVIDAFEARGWIYHGDICIDKDPQAQAIRTHSKGLLFVQLRRDASWLRPAMADYILVFRKPGDNAVPIHPDISNDEWIEWARPIWYGIRESDTLNAAAGSERADERHICPLQLGTIERCVRLWSNPGEMVFDPFAGIGSTGYVALQHGRRFLGVELKRSYAEAAARNLNSAPNVQLDLLTQAGEGQ